MGKLCIRCGGTGRYLGNGMIMTDCNLCDGSGVNVAPSLDALDRESPSYKTAIKDIMKVSKVNKIEATRMFDEAYAKG